MGLFDGIKKLTQPYDDDDGGSFAGARDDEEEFKTPAQMNRERERASFDFERSFGGGASTAAPEKAEDEAPEEDVSSGTSLLGNFSFKPKAVRKPAPFKGSGSGELHVFAPTTLKEMLGLKEYLENRVSVILKLDGLSDGMDRRLLDFASGMAYGLDGKLSPISGKTYLVSPQNVNIVHDNGSQNSVETASKFF